MADEHPLGFLIGRWEGSGRGYYPSIDPFGYAEVFEVRATPKGFLTHQQRTTHADDGRPLHVETGYWRVPEPGRAELVLAHPTGVVEVCEGDIAAGSVHVRSTTVAGTASAKPVASLERWYEVEGDVLRYRLSMGAVGLAHQPHLEAELRRSC